jgi:hypothetical protein
MVGFFMVYSIPVEVVKQESRQSLAYMRELWLLNLLNLPHPSIKRPKMFHKQDIEFDPQAL